MQTDSFGRQTVINYCKPGFFSLLNATIIYPGFLNTSTPLNAALPPIQLTSATFRANFSFDQTSFTRGLISSSETLFDGIACNDGDWVNQFASETSFVKDVIETNSDLTAITIETWFNLRGTKKSGDIVSLVD
jgi:hypothetical protein